MRITGMVLACLSASLLAGPAFAQGQGGSMSGGSMKSTNGKAMSGRRMRLNAQGGFGIFSREDMAMMIVDREKANEGMTADQVKAARAKEMAKDRAETPDGRMARKQRYDGEWAQLSPTEQSAALDKWHAQLVSMGMQDTAK
ncbi:MAG: hypothetical protein ACREFW_00500 [Rhizomicrobium sp.]